LERKKEDASGKCLIGRHKWHKSANEREGKRREFCSRGHSWKKKRKKYEEGSSEL